MTCCVSECSPQQEPLLSYDSHTLTYSAWALYVCRAFPACCVILRRDLRKNLQLSC
ncbi:hypothetical protein OBBRIDRAFT_798453 [Obba rivulosa]|uniref:Uncharacterized protein n=1 Tax=Obba rivulosa TaxID=1052685 RepID=A0A8E2ANQ8_9APHY|nr:hypothetical protein OBBRIDRAFT_798453 [Obba rivulosa]